MHLRRLQWISSGFSPVGLFASTAADGFWGDESDFSTLYQDIAGVTAVTAVGQPIGLMLDKHLGAVRGTNLGAPGTFDTTVETWSAYNANSVVTAVSGKLRVTTASAAISGYAQTSFPTTSGKWYYCEISCSNFLSTANSAVLYTGTASGTGNELTSTALAAPGVLSGYFKAGSSTTYVLLQSSGSVTGSSIDFDNFFLQLVDGNHATQATAANRLILQKDASGFYYAAANGTNQNITTTSGGGGTTGFFFCQAINPAGRGVALATPVNAAFATATTGGTLAAGTYYYRVSAINAYGETLASAETSQVTTGTTSTVTVNWGAVSGATGYKVYGRTTAGELLIATVGAVTTYIDTGVITPSGALPAANTTAYSVLWSDAGTNSGYKVVTNYAGNLLLQAGNGTAYTAATSTDVLALSTGAVVMVWDDATNLNAQIGSGTVFTAARPVVTAGTAATTFPSDNGAATGFFNGKLYPEVYFKNTGLTAAQRLQVQNYCKSKAGL
jgi:hypothetical protein